MMRMEQTDNGLLVKTIEGYDVYLVAQIFNWRIVLSTEGDEWGTIAGFCYFGRGDETLVRALSAATEWTDLARTSPVGFDKCAYDARALR